MTRFLNAHGQGKKSGIWSQWQIFQHGFIEQKEKSGEDIMELCVSHEQMTK